MDCSPPGSSVHGVLQARVLEWVSIPFSRGSSRLRDWTQVSCIAGGFFTTAKEAYAAAKSLQSCPTLCDPIDGSPPGSPVPGILQAEHWSGLPFPSPMHEREKWNWIHVLKHVENTGVLALCWGTLKIHASTETLSWTIWKEYIIGYNSYLLCFTPYWQSEGG